jgi:DNA-binding CsgD family transcriptional regulator
MVLLDGHRRVVDANGACISLLGHGRRQMTGRPIYEFILGGPRLTPSEWRSVIDAGRFTGEAELQCTDGTTVAVQFAANTEIVTGHHRVLFVALSTSRWGRRFRRTPTPEREPEVLSSREREVVRLVALGNTGPEIAEELRIAHDTVRTHARNAMVKVGARSRAHLVAKALGEGLVFD